MILLHYKLSNVKCQSKKKLDGKTVLVTGGTSGMGLELAKDLARRDARIIIACPFVAEGMSAQELITKETANQKVVFKHLDLSSLTSVRNFAEDLLKTEERLDILINNAGVITPDKITDDGMHFVMQVNYFGHFLLTHLLLPLLKKTGTPTESSRIVNVGSMSYIFGEINIETMHNNGNCIKKYFDSKLCATMFSRDLSKRLKDTNVIVNIADPGVASTRIIGNGRLINAIEYMLRIFVPTAWEGAQTALHLAVDEKAGELSGEYFANCKLSRASRKVYDEGVCQSLREESSKIVKLNANEIDLTS